MLVRLRLANQVSYFVLPSFFQFLVDIYRQGRMAIETREDFTSSPGVGKRLCGLRIEELNNREAVRAARLQQLVRASLRATKYSNMGLQKR